MQYCVASTAGNQPTIDRSLRHLAAAVLLQAAQDLFRGTPRAYRDAVDWIREGNRGAVTFEMCCRYLDRDLDTIRRRLLRRGLPPSLVLDWEQLQEANRPAA